MLWGWAHRCSSFKTLNVIAGAGQCVHCNLSLSSNLSANAPSHPLSSCSSSSFTSSCSTSLPSVLLSSLSRSPRPSVFFLFCFFSPPSHLAVPLPRGTWSRPAVTESHLVCSPLRLPDTQHPHRGLRWRRVEELMKPSAQREHTSPFLAVSEHLGSWVTELLQCVGLYVTPFEYLYMGTQTCVSTFPSHESLWHNVRCFESLSYSRDHRFHSCKTKQFIAQWLEMMMSCYE